MNTIMYHNGTRISLDSAIKKIQQFSTRKGINSVTFQHVKEFFQSYFNANFSEAMDQEKIRRKVLGPFKKIPSLLLTRFGRKAEKVAFRVLGAAISLQRSNSALSILPKDVLTKIFSDVIDKDYRNIRSVSCVWKECADSAWKESIKHRWVSPRSIEGTRQMFQTARYLNLKGVSQLETPVFLHLHPELEGLRLEFPFDHLKLFCPKIIELEIMRQNGFWRGDLSAFEHLKSFQFAGNGSGASIRIPPSIETVKLNNSSVNGLIFPETTCLKKFKSIGNRWGNIDLANPSYATLESLKVDRYGSVNWPASMDHLATLTCDGISRTTGFEFSQVSFPQLQYLRVLDYDTTLLPPARLMPKLEFLEIQGTLIEERLSLEWYSKLKKVILGGLDLESVTLPESIEKVTIEGCEELTELVLPVEPNRLKRLVLKDVSLEEIDLSRFTSLKSIEIESSVECHLILGEHSPEPTVSKNVLVTYGSKKKRKVKGG